MSDFYHWLETEMLQRIMKNDRMIQISRRDLKDALEEAYNKGYADHVKACDEQKMILASIP